MKKLLLFASTLVFIQAASHTSPVNLLASLQERMDEMSAVHLLEEDYTDLFLLMNPEELDRKIEDLKIFIDTLCKDLEPHVKECSNTIDEQFGKEYVDLIEKWDIEKASFANLLETIKAKEAELGRLENDLFSAEQEIDEKIKELSIISPEDKDRQLVVLSKCKEDLHSDRIGEIENLRRELAQNNELKDKLRSRMDNIEREVDVKEKAQRDFWDESKPLFQGFHDRIEGMKAEMQGRLTLLKEKRATISSSEQADEFGLPKRHENGGDLATNTLDFLLASHYTGSLNGQITTNQAREPLNDGSIDKSNPYEGLENARASSVTHMPPKNNMPVLPKKEGACG